MPTLSPGITASIALEPNDSYTISSVGGSATVKGIYGAPSTTTTLTSNSQVFGPYGVHAKLDIACLSGVTNYTLDQFPKSAVPLSAALTVSSSDDGKVYESTTAVTVTIPQGLSPKPAVVFIPKGGTITVAVTGSATINGAATSLARTLANNPAGFVVQPYLDANGYGASGS